MKPIFFLIPLLVLLSISLIPYSYAEIEKGFNYDHEILETFEDGTQKIKFTSKPDRILVNGNYQDFRFTDDTTHLTLETGHGSIKLNKLTCSFDFYKNGIITDKPLFSDSIVSKMAINGTENWNEITEISNAICETYGSKDQLVAKKYAPGVGFIEYKYINTGSSFKTQLEITNLSNDIDKKYGFTQTINLNRDSIFWGDAQKNLDNFNNQTFNRDWLDRNNAENLDFLNGFTFNFDVSFPKLKSVYVLDPGKDKSKLSFNYFKNLSTLLPNEKLIIDPTYSYTTGTKKSPYSNNGNCETNLGGDTLGYVGTIGTFCYYHSVEWDISSITDGYTITDSKIRYDTTSTLNAPNCNVVQMSLKPSTSTNAQIQADIIAGSVYTSLVCSSDQTNTVLDLGSSADAKIQSQLASNYFAIGIIKNPNELATIKSTIFGDVELEVTYVSILQPNAIIDLSASSITQTTATLSFTAPNLNGESLINYMLNVTTPQASTSPTFHSNTTSTTINLTGLTLGTGYTAQASAFTLGGANWTYANVLNFTTLLYTPPSAPTLTALSESDSSVRFISTNGTTNDLEMFYYGLRCLENSETSWTTIVSNSTTPNPRVYSYTLAPGDYVTCQWRDGSLAGFSDWSNNATETTGQIGIIQDARSDNSDALMNFTTWIEDEGGLYFGMGVFPMVIMLIGFMATKATVRIFTIITLMAMGIIHASGFFVYPDWYWTLAVLFGIVLVLGRQARD